MEIAITVSLSDDNWITAIGCNVMLNGVIGEDKRSSIQSSCTAICSDSRRIYDDGETYAECIYKPTSHADDGCCRVPIPRGTTYLESNLTHLSELPTSPNIYCSYAFTEYTETMSEDYGYYEGEFMLTNNSKMIPLINAHPIASMALDWRIGRMDCKEARQDITNFVCRNNSDCVDFDPTLGGYLCNCSKGYTGNPYLNPGCQDINECADDSTNTCVSNSICENVPGTFHCSCPKGYIGDGKKDGTNCILPPPSKTKMTILTGIGSGLWFLLLVSVFFWMSKMSSGVNVESEDVRYFEDMSAMISDTEYTWTNSYKNASASSSETHPLVLFESSGICAKRVVVDARNHMLGRLASILAKELLNGQRVVVVRCEEICLSGGLVRQKMKYLRFLRKRMNTKPSHGPIHFRAPSKILWRTIRGMIPHKTKRGEAALARLKVYEGVPPPYDKIKRMVIPDALKVLRLQAGHKYCLLGRLSSEVGWNHYDTIRELEKKRKDRAQVTYEKRKQLNKLRAKAEKVAIEKLGSQLDVIAPIKY
ncbi:hypothetical protein SASPL_151747 [Salvia splendens]|uniref:EGF-like domain-containing protein n=2 Tax=Salvia splendens TaxID=180675 RepID=A0A8X8W2G8_SALSN|nr:hypothetical protein SASPL_151747 [Salvia splendens]